MNARKRLLVSVAVVVLAGLAGGAVADTWRCPCGGEELNFDPRHLAYKESIIRSHIAVHCATKPPPPPPSDPFERDKKELGQGIRRPSAPTGSAATPDQFATDKETLREYLRRLDPIQIAKAQLDGDLVHVKLYEMYAKSWINGPAIIEPTWSARKIQLSVNVEPNGPVASAAFDYKIYQAFAAEVKFKGRQIVAARFIDSSRVARANTTLGLRGEVRVTAEQVQISPDRSRVVFTRRIEGNPNLILKATDVAAAEAIWRSWGLNLPATDIKIYNLLELTVTSDSAKPFAIGSSFPSHYFWILDAHGAQRFLTQSQVQPSQYFQPLMGR